MMKNLDHDALTRHTGNQNFKIKIDLICFQDNKWRRLIFS